MKDRRDRSRSNDRQNDRGRSNDRQNDRGRSKDRQNDRGRSNDRQNDRGRVNRRPAIDVPDKTPVIGKIYPGKITSITDFGCFVQLNGLEKRMEGLVHISQLRKEGNVS